MLSCSGSCPCGSSVPVLGPWLGGCSRCDPDPDPGTCYRSEAVHAMPHFSRGCGVAQNVTLSCCTPPAQESLIFNMRASSASLAPEQKQKYWVVEGRPPKSSDRVRRCPMGLSRDPSEGTFELLADWPIVVGVRGTQCSDSGSVIWNFNLRSSPSHRDTGNRCRLPFFTHHHHHHEIPDHRHRHRRRHMPRGFESATMAWPTGVCHCRYFIVDPTIWPPTNPTELA